MLAAISTLSTEVLKTKGGVKKTNRCAIANCEKQNLFSELYVVCDYLLHPLCSRQSRFKCSLAVPKQRYLFCMTMCVTLTTCITCGQSTLPSKKKIINCLKGQCHEMDIFRRSCDGVPPVFTPAFPPAHHVTYTRCFPHVDIVHTRSSLRCLAWNTVVLQLLSCIHLLYSLIFYSVLSVYALSKLLLLCLWSGLLEGFFKISK